MKALSHVFGGWPHPAVGIRLVRDWADLAHFVPWLEERAGQHLGIDCETNAMDPWHQGFRTRTVQMADMFDAWVIDLENEDPLWSQTIAELIKRHRYWVAHFAEVDIRFMHRGMVCRDGSSPIRLGEKIPNVADTQTVLAMYDPRTVTTHSKKDRIHYKIPRLKGLKETTERLLTPELKLAEERMHARFRELAPVGHRQGKQKSIKWGFANIPVDDDLFVVYAGLDAVACIRLWHLMRHELRQRGQLARCNAALIEQWMMDQATLAGMRVDGPYARWFFDQLTQSIKDNARILAPHGVGESGQGVKVGEAFTRLGVAPVKTKRNDAGAEVPTWDKEAMAKLAEHPNTVVSQLAKAVSAARRATKFRTTYVEPMLRAVDFGDGAMHCSVRAIGTVTTRMSAQKTESAGPLQQLPKKDPRVRAAVASRRGCVLVSADFAQGEPFTMAALSGDEVYLADLQAGDINSTIAAMIYGDAYDPRYGKTAGTPHYLMRQRAKAGWLALCYGAGAQKFADTLGITLEAGTAARARLKGRYVKLWAFADAMNHQAVIQLDSGHRVPLWDRFGVTADGELFVGEKPSRLGLNAATQSAQSDLLRVAMHRLNEWGWSWALRFALHDELLLEVPEWMAEQAREVLERAMTVTYRGVAVHCEATVEGRTWMPQPEEFDLNAIPDLDDEESVYAAP